MDEREAFETLRGLGFEEPEAKMLTAHFVDAERRGKTGHGFSRVDNQIDAFKRVSDFLKAHVPPADCSCEIKPM